MYVHNIFKLNWIIKNLLSKTNYKQNKIYLNLFSGSNVVLVLIARSKINFKKLLVSSYSCYLHAHRSYIVSCDLSNCF